MAKSTDKIRDTIRKLLTLAEGTHNVNEQEAFLAKAVELMSRHGVESADLFAEDSTSDTVTSEKIEVLGPYALPKVRLLESVVELFGGQSAYRRTSTNSYAVTVFAYGADLERITMLWTLLSGWILRDLAAPAPRGRNTKTWRRSWLEGFRYRVMHRLRTIMRDAYTDAAARPEGVGERFALTVRDKDTIVTQRFNSAYPDLETTRPRRVQYDSAGVVAGREAGDRADIGTSRLGGGTRASIPG